MKTHLRRALALGVIGTSMALAGSPAASANSGSQTQCGRYVTGVNAYHTGFHSIGITMYPRACVRATAGGPGSTTRTYWIPWTQTPKVLVTALSGEVTASTPVYATRWTNSNGTTRKVRYDFVVKYCATGVVGCTSEKMYFYESYSGTQIYRPATSNYDTFDYWD